MASAYEPEEMQEEEGDAPLSMPAKPELEDTYIVDVAGNISIVRTVKGERPQAGTPLGPTGSRVATQAEIDAYKAAQT
jgi:hypothetical protein